MHIQRVQIEEGFLDGLDVSFAPGLNAIIGARGTGKTSLIEVVRFCLDVSSTTSEATRRSKDHALSILGSGQVTVTLSDNNQSILVSRTANDEKPRTTSSFHKPIIFSQTEIESVGLEATGRLKLLDGFVSVEKNTGLDEKQLVNECLELTRQIEACRSEVEQLDQVKKYLPDLYSELKENEKAESEVSKTSSYLNEKTQLLSNHSKEISDINVTLQKLIKLRGEVAGWSHEVKKAADFGLSDNINADIDSESYSLFISVHARVQGVNERLNNELNEVLSIYQSIDSDVQKLNAAKLTKEDTARQLRGEVENIQSGSGAVLRRGQELREQIASISYMVEHLAKQNLIMLELVKKRSILLDKLDDVRFSRYKAREDAANELNKLVGPSIRVSILRNGQVKKFSSVISEYLRGSGLRYAEVVDAIACHLSPRALMEAIENFDTETIADAANITIDRASRLLSHLQKCDLGEMCTLDIEDDVALQLLDGTDYKDISELSTGQRCTVVLPLILSHMNRMLIVDQPEDHIDNAFIANTLIKVIVSRHGQGQIVFSTHNPNIPVLGSADMVLHLGSDGRRGFRMSAGALHDPNTVSAISTVMEGGAEAFSKRADFYSGNF